jgi:hypothetical protein
MGLLWGYYGRTMGLLWGKDDIKPSEIEFLYINKKKSPAEGYF